MPAGIAIRRATAADLRRIVAVELASFRADAWPREAFTSLMNECPRLFLVATLAGRMAGYSSAVADAKRAELVSIAVHPRYRRRGVARALINRTLALLRGEGVRQCWLTVRPANAEAIRLYESFGFRHVRRVKDYYGRGRDGKRMRLLLS